MLICTLVPSLQCLNKLDLRGWADGQTFTDHDTELATAFASIVAVALERATVSSRRLNPAFPPRVTSDIR